MQKVWPVVCAALLLSGCSRELTPSHARATSNDAPQSKAPTPVHPEHLVVTDLGSLLPISLERAVAEPYHHHILVAGGLDASGNSTDGVYEVDPAGRRSVLLGHMPVPFHDAAGALIGSRLLVFGGGQVASTTIVQSFDIRTHRSRVIANLPIPLSDLASTTIGGDVFLVGGFDGSNPQPSIYETNDGMTFDRIATLPIGLRYAAVGTVGSRVLIAGGIDVSGTSPRVYSMEASTHDLTRYASLPDSIAHACAFTLAGDVFIAGGTSANGKVVTAIRQIAGRRISGRVHLPLPMSDAAAATIGNDAYLVGGSDGNVPTSHVVRISVQTR